MTTLLDQDQVTAAEVAGVEDAIAGLLRTRHDVLLVQAEAILALEAAARALGAPGSRALNVVTGPYGALFGDWMRASGAEVVDVRTAADEVVTVAAVREALGAHPDTAVLALVHAEAATGGSNPVAEIVGLAAERGVRTVVDAVASVGAEPVDPDGWGADVVVIGGQKALAGPAGVSAAIVSDAAWEWMERNPRAPRASFLSLLDLREGWLRTGRRTVVGTPNTLETRALGQALDRIAAEGLDAVIARHALARDATLAGVHALGLQAWQRDPAASGAAVATTVALAVPGGVAIDPDTALGGIVGRGNGPLAAQLVRVNHAGRGAASGPVIDAIERLARSAGSDPARSVEAAEAVFAS